MRCSEAMEAERVQGASRSEPLNEKHMTLATCQYITGGHQVQSCPGIIQNYNGSNNSNTQQPQLPVILTALQGSSISGIK